jgi:hypothetical protein
MSRIRLQFIVLASWFIAVAALSTVRLTTGTPPSLADGIMVLLLAGAPAVVFRKVFRGAPPVTIAQVLYDSEHMKVSVASGLAQGPRAGVAQ